MENREKLTVMRRVRPEEKERVLTLVSDVFEIEQGVPRDMDDIPAEKSPQWWCIEISGRIVGGIVSWEEPEGPHVGRFAVHPSFRHRHLGTDLLRGVLSALFALGASEVYGDARDVTLKILLKMGAEVIDEPYEFYSSNCTPFRVKKNEFIESQRLK